jgi:hypothetical protein
MRSFITCTHHSFIHSSMALKPFVGLVLFFSFVIFFTQTVGLLGQVISPSQGLYLYIGQHKHRINAHADIHALNGIRNHDPSVRANEDSSCLRLRGHRDRNLYSSANIIRMMKSGTMRWTGHVTRVRRREMYIGFW